MSGDPELYQALFGRLESLHESGALRTIQRGQRRPSNAARKRRAASAPPAQTSSSTAAAAATGTATDNDNDGSDGDNDNVVAAVQPTAKHRKRSTVVIVSVNVTSNSSSTPAGSQQQSSSSAAVQSAAPAAMVDSAAAAATPAAAAALPAPVVPQPIVPRIDYTASYAQQALYAAPAAPLLGADEQRALSLHAHFLRQAAADARIIEERQRVRHAAMRQQHDGGGLPLSTLMERAYAQDGLDYAAQDDAAVLDEERARRLLSATTPFMFETFFEALRSPLPHQRRCMRENDCYGLRVTHGDMPPQILREDPPAEVLAQFAQTRQWPTQMRWLCAFCAAIEGQALVAESTAEERAVRPDVLLTRNHFIVDVPGGFSRYDCIQSPPELYTGAFAPQLLVCLRHYEGRWMNAANGTTYYQLVPVGLLRVDATASSSSSADQQQRVEELVEETANFRGGPPPNTFARPAAPPQPAPPSAQ